MAVCLPVLLTRPAESDVSLAVHLPGVLPAVPAVEDVLPVVLPDVLVAAVFSALHPVDVSPAAEDVLPAVLLLSAPDFSQAAVDEAAVPVVFLAAAWDVLLVLLQVLLPHLLPLPHHLSLIHI